MKQKRKKRDFLRVLDLSRDEIQTLIDRALEIKRGYKDGLIEYPLRGKTVGLIFEKQSTRTRISFEVAAFQLGGHSIYLSPEKIQMSRGEGIRETARVLSRYVDCLVIRTYEHKIIEEWARYATIPVINGLTDTHHPCQILSDLLTIYEKKGKIQDITVAYIGDGNNIAHSLIEGAALMGMRLNVATPSGFEPDQEIVKRSMDIASTSGASIKIMTDPVQAVRGAHVVYTDTWVSMGQEGESNIRKQSFKGYQINRTLMENASDDAIIMHCLPAHIGEEITEDMIESPRSVVFDQAENRLHMQKALLIMLLRQ